MKEPRKQFTFYKSYYDAIQELPKKDQSDLILAICAYALYERSPEGLSVAGSIAFKLIKPTLDAGRRKAESGALGGQANSKQTESKTEANLSKPQAKPSKPQANRKQGEIAREKEKEKEIEKEIEYEVEADVEGECEEPSPDDNDGDDDSSYNELNFLGGTLGKGVVKLSQAQFDSLLDTLGLDMFDHYVSRLADFIIDKNAVIHNHYETILKWWKEDQAI